MRHRQDKKKSIHVGVPKDSPDLPRSSASGHDASSDTQSSSEPWITWFCSIRGNEFFTEVDERWMQDEFNLYGLSDHVPHYGFARDLILDRECEVELNPEQNVEVEKMAEHLYGLIHARYIVSPWGLEQMCQKYKNMDFGRCPRVYCEGQATLPIGLSDLPRNSYARLYCPRCNDIYLPVSKHSHIDGAYFGTTFPHLLFQTYPEFIPQPPKSFVPRIFGFKIHKSSRDALVKAHQARTQEQKKGLESIQQETNYYTGGSTSSVSQIYSRGAIHRVDSGLPSGDPAANLSSEFTKSTEELMRSDSFDAKKPTQSSEPTPTEQ